MRLSTLFVVINISSLLMSLCAIAQEPTGEDKVSPKDEADCVVILERPASCILPRKQEPWTPRVPLPMPKNAEHSKSPRLKTYVKPVYPKEAVEKKLTGRVVLYISIDSEGNITKAEVASADNSIFSQPSLEAVKQWRYCKQVDELGYPLALDQFVTINYKLP